MRFHDAQAPIWFFNGLLIAGAVAGTGQRPPDVRTGADRPTPRIERPDPDGLSARELRALPGIGPARALAITRARWEGLRGGPAAWAAILGIGEATVAAAAAALSLRDVEPPSERAYTPRGPP